MEIRECFWYNGEGFVEGGAVMKENQTCDCGVCARIDLTKQGKNRYFVRELETGYVVIGDHQRFKGYSLFL